MPALCKRRISQIGGSKVIPLPLDWTRAFNLDRGDTVDAYYDSILIITPHKLQFDTDQILRELRLLAKYRESKEDDSISSSERRDAKI